MKFARDFLVRRRVLKRPAQHEEFRTRYEACGGFPLSVEYLADKEVFGIFDEDGHMVGGYVFNSNAPFRALEDMPEIDRRRVMDMLDVPKTYEVTCVGVRPELRKGSLSTAMWGCLVGDVMKRPHRAVLLCTVSSRLRELYRSGRPRLLYTGTIEMPDRVLPKFVLVYASRWGLLRGLLIEACKRPFKKPSGPRLVPAEV